MSIKNEGDIRMSNKVTIIGAGSVGSTVAYTLAVQGTVSEIVIIDIKKEKAEPETALPSLFHSSRQGLPELIE